MFFTIIGAQHTLMLVSLSKVLFILINVVTLTNATADFTRSLCLELNPSLCLEINNGSKVLGLQNNTQAELWDLVVSSSKFVSEGTEFEMDLRTSSTPLECLSPSSSNPGSQIASATCDNSSNWFVSPLDRNSPNTYTIKDGTSNLCLTAMSNESHPLLSNDISAAALVELQTCFDVDNCNCSDLEVAQTFLIPSIQPTRSPVVTSPPTERLQPYKPFSTPFKKGYSTTVLLCFVTIIVVVIVKFNMLPSWCTLPNINVRNWFRRRQDLETLGNPYNLEEYGIKA